MKLEEEESLADSPNRSDASISGDLPTFGGSLAHLAYTSESFVTPKISPTRQLRSTTRSVTGRPDVSTNSSKNDTPSHTSEAAFGHVTKAKRKIKLEDSDHETDGLLNAGSPQRPPTKSPRKKVARKNVQSFEGMAEIPDRLAEDLDILFCGYNPGVRSSQEGFHYAHPSNRFYRILHASGLTPYRLAPSESPTMPERYCLGLTDLVARCTARADQVSQLEFEAGAPDLLEKLIRWKPLMVCFVGMDVYRNFRKHFPKHLVKTSPRSTTASPISSPSKGKCKQSNSDVQLGTQDLIISVAGWKNTDERHFVRLLVIPSTSGLAAGYTDADRVHYLTEARESVSSIRAGTLPRLEDSVILKAEDFLAAQIRQSSPGRWSRIT